jgi:RimJ/RimL family protein N-acetyltransferase
MSALPARVTTSRLLLRTWTPQDQPVYEETVGRCLDHLRPWLPWARVPLEEQWASLEEFQRRPESAQDLIYALFDADETELLGGVGVHHRGNEGEREIGYWLHAGATGQGYMSEAVVAATSMIFATLSVEAVTIVCDPANDRSAAVPKRIGYALAGIFPVTVPNPDRTENMIWRTTREAWSRLHTGIVV